jgi:hypothetical protein
MEDPELGNIVFALLVMGWITPVGVLRMWALGMTTRELLLSFIPFYGLKYRFKRIFGKK